MVEFKSIKIIMVCILYVIGYILYEEKLGEKFYWFLFSNFNLNFKKYDEVKVVFDCVVYFSKEFIVEFFSYILMDK